MGLAITLAVLSAAISAADMTAPQPPPVAVESAPTPRGWLGLGGRNAVGLTDAVAPDFGIELIGGVWLLREHLQPLLRIGWSHGFGAGLAIDALRFSAGAAGGGSLAHEHVWIGGGLEIGAVGGYAHGDAGSSTAWGATLSPSALVLFRFLRRVVVGVQFGPEFLLPALRFEGANGAVQWGVFRFNAGLRIGVLLGRPLR